MGIAVQDTKKVFTSRNDVIFKTIICDEYDKRFIKKILEAVLNIKIYEITYMKSERPKLNKKERNKIVDLLLKTNDNKVIHVELNNGLKDFTRFRNYAYFSSIIATEIKVKEEYDLSKEYIHIDFTYGFSKKDKIRIHEYYMQTLVGRKYIDNVRVIEVNMDMMKRVCYNEGEYKYLAMLDMTPEELSIYEGDELIMDYKKVLEKINEDEEMYQYLSDEEAIIKEYNSDIKYATEKGIEKGELKGKSEMIRSMQINGIDIESISKISNLSIEEVNKILNSN